MKRKEKVEDSFLLCYNWIQQKHEASHSFILH